MAGEQGFEPRFCGPEPHVLPLDDSPAGANRELYQTAPQAFQEPVDPRERPLAADNLEHLEEAIDLLTFGDHYNICGLPRTFLRVERRTNSG